MSDDVLAGIERDIDALASGSELTARLDACAALADAPVEQGDVNRVQPVLHNVPNAGFRRPTVAGWNIYAKAGWMVQRDSLVIVERSAGRPER